jgi:hypothetical protein
MATGTEPASRSGLRGRIAGAFSGPRDLVSIVYRDPQHVAERLTLYAAQHLGEPSRTWAEEARRAHPTTPPAQLAADLRMQSAKIARVDGAIAGTPFLLALVPGYVTYLWQEARMALRTAALYGHDPAALGTAAEMLALRGVHPTVASAAHALAVVRDGPPPKPVARRSLRTWIASVRAILIFGGFLSASQRDQPVAAHARLRAAVGVVLGAAIWVMTWVLPVTFMIAMAWGCESHTRQLGRRVLAFYDGDAADPRTAIAVAARHEDRGHDRRRILRTVAFALSVIVPIAFVAYANHVRQSTGVNWIAAVGALVAVSLVAATVVVGSRR